MNNKSTPDRIIKKYKNRRLYDMELSQYIKVEDLQTYVLNGIAFRVVEAEHGNDITSATLLQILVEMEMGKTPILSEDVLRQFIILAHHPLHQSFKNILEQMMTTINNQFETSPYLTDLQKYSDKWAKQTQQMLDQWQAIFKP